MTIPEGFAQTTIDLGGSGLPRGAAVVFGTVRNIEKTASQHATDLHDAFADAFCPVMASTVIVEGALTKFGPDETGPSGVSSGITRAGTAAGNQTSSQVSYLMTKNTGLGGRRGKGRMYIPGPVEDAVSPSGAVLAGIVTALNTAGAGFLAALDTLGMDLVLLHDPPTVWQLVNGQPRRIPQAGAIPEPTVVTSLTGGATVATQRRRLR